MQPTDLHTIVRLKKLVDAENGPDLILDREIDRHLRKKGFLLPWTSSVDSALLLFTEFGVEPGELLAEVCKHQDELRGKHFISRLPRGIISIGLGYLLRREKE